MDRKKIFMYATQSKLVEEESFLFHKLGFDVYTAAWATDQTTHFRGYKDYNPNHFYQGKCDFLTDDEINVLSKVDVSWDKLPTVSTRYVPEVRDVLLDKFDILYVIAPTPWLLYGEDFLKAGKKVVFRPFGYAPYTWGKSVDISVLSNYEDFHVVTCTPYDVKHYKNVSTAITMVNKDLILDPAPQGDHIFTIFPIVNGQIKNDLAIKLNALKIPWVLHEYHYEWKSSVDMDKLFSSSVLYFDLNSMVRYPILEAMAHGKAVVMRGSLSPKTPQAFVFLVDAGLDPTIPCYYKDFGNAPSVVAKLYASSELRDRVATVQTTWLDSMIDKAIEVWSRVLEVNNG